MIHVAPTKKRPHIISVDIGKVRKGQIVIRRGSSTDGVTISDLLESFYGITSDYSPGFVKQLDLDVRRQEAWTAQMAELRRGTESAEDGIWHAAGFPGKPRSR